MVVRVRGGVAQARVRRSDCRNGRNLWRGMAVCKARGAEHVTLVFSIPGYQGPFDRLASGDPPLFIGAVAPADGDPTGIGDAAAQALRDAYDQRRTRVVEA